MQEIFQDINYIIRLCTELNQNIMTSDSTFLGKEKCSVERLKILRNINGCVQTLNAKVDLLKL
jgi:hypothetical protein